MHSGKARVVRASVVAIMILLFTALFVAICPITRNAVIQMAAAQPQREAVFDSVSDVSAAGDEDATANSNDSGSESGAADTDSDSAQSKDGAEGGQASDAAPSKSAPAASDDAEKSAASSKSSPKSAEAADPSDAASESGKSAATPATEGDDASATEDPATEGETTNDEPAEVSNSSASADPEDDRDELTYEDDVLVATVKAPADTLPQGAQLEVKEIHPVDADAGEDYSEAVTKLAETLREKEVTCSGMKVYDIRILNESGNEIEPRGEVSVRLEYKKAQAIGEKPESVEVAHFDDEGDLTLMKADVDTNRAGKVTSAEFTTNSFSYYIVFSNNGASGSTEEPAVKAGDLGWVRFATVGAQNDNWGYYQTESNFASIDSDDAKRRIVQVKLWKKKTNGAAAEFDEGDYEELTAIKSQYFWTWENQLMVSEFDFPDYEVVHTVMHTAWDDAAKDRSNDSLIDTYDIRGWRTGLWDADANPHIPEGAQQSDLNVLNVYLKDSTKREKDSTAYIVRYVHADGSISDGNVRYLKQGQSVDVSAEGQRRTGEIYSGMSIVTGVKATNIDKATGSGEISYNESVDLAKVYIYYKEDPAADATTSTKDRYDKNDNDEYFTGDTGLYTNKKANKTARRKVFGD